MSSIAKLAHVRKAARVDNLPHAVKITGSADYWTNRADNSDNLRGKSDGRIKGLSVHALSRLREAIAATAHISGYYHTYGLCLTLPWGDKDNGEGSPTQADGAEIWRDWVHNLPRMLDKWGIGMIYRVELQQRRAVHWHMLVYLPDDLDLEWAQNECLRMAKRYNAWDWWHPGKLTKHDRPMLDIGADGLPAHYYALLAIRLTWCNTILAWHNGATAERAWSRLSRPCSAPPPAPIKTLEYCVNAVSVHGIAGALAYLASHTTKHKQEQLGYVGKQWGYLGRKWLTVAEPVPIVEPSSLSHTVRIRAYRLIRAWARRNAYNTDWRVLRPRRRLTDDGGEVYAGLVVRNCGTIYIMGKTQSIIKTAFDCAKRG